jgi:hypothetical protein
MFRVIGEGRYKRWCEARSLDIATASFQIETCYYGRGLRARPGALLVSSGFITHYSYRWFDTIWAVGEPSVRVDIPASEISDVRREPLSLRWRLMYLGTHEAFVVTMLDGKEHFLVLLRDADEFERAVSEERRYR